MIRKLYKNIFYILFVISIFSVVSFAQEDVDEFVETESFEEEVEKSDAEFELGDEDYAESFEESKNESLQAEEDELDDDLEDDFEEEFKEDNDASKVTEKNKDKKQEESLEEDFAEEDFEKTSEEDISFDDFDEEPAEAIVEDDFQQLESEPAVVTEELERVDDYSDSVDEESVVPVEPEIVEEPVVEKEEPIFEEPVKAVVKTDKPDLNFEAKLNSIYLDYYREEMPKELWKSLIGTRQEESYTIQPGDNLWGLSQTFFGEGEYWPKIWSVNGRITNPHLIEPGLIIRFLLGDELDPPAFMITEEDDSLTNKAIVQSAENQDDQVIVYDDGTQVVIPKPFRKPKPLPKGLPDSLPKWIHANAFNDKEVEVKYLERKFLNEKEKVLVSHHLTDAGFDELGKILEIESGMDAAMTLQYVYVKSGKGSFKAGDRLQIIADKGKIKLPDGVRWPPISTYKKPKVVEVQGILEIAELVDKVEKRKKPTKYIYKAMIIETVHPIRRGSSLIDRPLQWVSLDYTKPSEDFVSQIIGGELDEKRKIIGAYSLVYLNKGSLDGMEVGKRLNVYANPKARNSRSKILSHQRNIGQLQVVDVSERYSTAAVMQSFDDIRPGDYTFSTEDTLPSTLLKKDEDKDESVQKAELDVEDDFEVSEESFEESTVEEASESEDSDFEDEFAE